MDVGRHPKIKLHTYSEVISLSGQIGDFSVKLLKKPRYVREDICTGCGKCIEKCPRKVVDLFDEGLRMREAIYFYFPQGVPHIVTIDPDACLKIQRGKCGICSKLCELGAIDYEQKEKEETLNVAAIIIATGFDLRDPDQFPELGYKKCKNVISSLEFERLISPSGPTSGHLLRPSDKKSVKTMAIIQCVGSRHIKKSAYCSSVCCMHATKAAILANEHDREVKTFIFYADMRAVGKGFQEYIQRAKNEYNVTYIRGRVPEITADFDDNPLIHYEDMENDITSVMRVDLVVLSTSLIPSKGVEKLASILRVELDEHRFIRTDPFQPLCTNVPGIFVCGYAQGPLDIPESVVQASAAAALATEVVKGGVVV